MSERTLILIKPDGVQRGLIGEVVRRFEKRGFKLLGAKMMMVSRDLAMRHYSAHQGKDFFERLVEYITAGPVLAMVWEANGIIGIVREMMGATFGHEARPGTIRGDFCVGRFNVIHGSDSAESAEHEISLFFKEDEIIDYEADHEQWLVE